MGIPHSWAVKREQRPDVLLPKAAVAPAHPETPLAQAQRSQNRSEDTGLRRCLHRDDTRKSTNQTLDADNL